MTQSDYLQLKKILSQAYDLSESKRMVFINGACDGKPELRNSVLEMLDIATSPKSIALDHPAIKILIPEMNTNKVSVLANGTQINEYTIIELLGSGGMGQVYAAQQKYPAEKKGCQHKVKMSAFLQS